MNDRFIFIGESGTGKSTAALGFMTSPKDAAIIQHKGSAGFRYLAGIPALKDLTIRDAANFADFARFTAEAIKAKKTLVIVDDYDYLFRDEQRGVRLGKNGNEKRLASQEIYEQAETTVKALMECGATVIFTCKAVSTSAGRDGGKFITEVKPFLPGLHAHMETGLVDGVFHFTRAGQKFTARTRGWEVDAASQVTRYYAKATLGLGDYLPETIAVEKTPGKPYSQSILKAMESARQKMAAAWGEAPSSTETGSQAALELTGGDK